MSFLEHVFDEIPGHIISEVLIIISFICYTNNLNDFNRLLLQNFGDDYVSMAVEHGYTALVYLCIAIVLEVLLIVINFFILKKLKYVGGYALICLFIFLIMNFIFAGVLIKMIYIPVLRVAMIVMLGGGTVVGLLSS